MATHPTCNLVDISATIGSIKSGINNMKVSISLPDELVRYIDQRVENRSRLIELLLQAWRKQQEQQAMVEACFSIFRALRVGKCKRMSVRSNPLVSELFISIFSDSVASAV